MPTVTQPLLDGTALTVNEDITGDFNRQVMLQLSEEVHTRGRIRQSHDVHTLGNVVLRPVLLNESKGYVGARPRDTLEHCSGWLTLSLSFTGSDIMLEDSDAAELVVSAIYSAITVCRKLPRRLSSILCLEHLARI